MSSDQQGPRVSRGEQAMYGELALVVRQVSTAFVALSEARDTIVQRLNEFYDDLHGPVGETGYDLFGTAAEGAVRNDWEESFVLVAEAEMALQRTLFGVTDRALRLQRAAREGIDSLPAFTADAFGVPHRKDKEAERRFQNVIGEAFVQIKPFISESDKAFVDEIVIEKIADELARRDRTMH